MGTPFLFNSAGCRDGGGLAAYELSPALPAGWKGWVELLISAASEIAPVVRLEGSGAVGRSAQDATVLSEHAAGGFRAIFRAHALGIPARRAAWRLLDQPGLDFEEFPGSRHYFPHAIGLVLAISALLSLAAYFRESRGWRVVAMIGLLAVPALAHQEFQPLAEIREINGVRSQFFDALNAAICAVHFEQVSRPHLIRLPDFPLSDVRADLHIRPPFDQERYGFTLEYYARIPLSSCADADLIRFSPMNRSRDRSEFAEALALPEVHSFYAKYFPEGSGAPRK